MPTLVHCKECKHPVLATSINNAVLMMATHTLTYHGISDTKALLTAHFGDVIASHIIEKHMMKVNEDNSNDESEEIK